MLHFAIQASPTFLIFDIRALWHSGRQSHSTTYNVPLDTAC